jgi:hydroxyacylglutathione hydrolase
MHLKQFFVEGLGHASYLIGSDRTGEAAVVDPQRDVDAYIQEAGRLGLRIRYVLETHNHNDFLSGARTLAQRSGAVHVASAEAGLAFPYRGVREGDEIRLGELRITVLFTPGHTPEHVTYVVIDTARAEQPVLAFTGGDLLVGSVGRPDLLGRELGEKLAPLLYDSLHEKILKLADYVEVLPTHGAGSLCGKSIGNKLTSTIGYERRFNEALQIEDRDEFVRSILSGNPGIPTYYRRMRPANQEGVPGWSVPGRRPLSAEEVRHMAGHGALVLDTRHHAAFGEAHVLGSVNIELQPSFATWAGWLLDPETSIVLVLESDDLWDEVVTSLARVGYERVAGYLRGGVQAWIGASLPVAQIPQRSVHELRDQLPSGSRQLIDVRMDSEREDGHIAGATHLRLDQLLEALPGLSVDGPVAIICGSGFRSSIATSLLARHGFRDVVNIAGGMEAWDAAGYPKIAIGDEAGRVVEGDAPRLSRAA